MIYYRTFDDYEAYKEIQGHKALNNPQHIIDGEEKRKEAFKIYLEVLKEYMMPGKVLCMGARTGAEVGVFKEMGFSSNSVGVDLWPLDEKVIKADWENTPFDSCTFQNVFTNALDHCRNFNAFLKEVNRVLINDGIFTFITDADYALKERNITYGEVVHNNINPLNAMFWDNIVDVLNALAEFGFILTFFKNKNNRIFVSCKKGVING